VIPRVQYWEPEVVHPPPLITKFTVLPGRTVWGQDIVTLGMLVHVAEPSAVPARAASPPRSFGGRIVNANQLLASVRGMPQRAFKCLPPLPSDSVADGR